MTALRIEEALDSEPLSVHDIISIFHAEVVDHTPPGYRMSWEDDIPWLSPRRGPINYVRRWWWQRKEGIE
jgi:hypothetical protein